MMKKLILTLGFLGCATAAQAVTVFDEAALGDFGNNRPNAEALGTTDRFSPFQVIGTVNGTGDSNDWVSFTAVDPFQVNVTQLALASRNNNIRVLLRDGITNATLRTELVGATGTDIFGQIAAGSYFIQVNENQGGANAYGLNIAAVPLPAPALMLLSGLLGFGVLRRARRRPAAA